MKEKPDDSKETDKENTNATEGKDESKPKEADGGKKEDAKVNDNVNKESNVPALTKEETKEKPDESNKGTATESEEGKKS